MRRGVTLLEILFSIFILFAGLLGVAVLVSTGARYASDADTLTRSDDVGTAAATAFDVRGWADPLGWYFPNGTPRYLQHVDESQNRPNVFSLNPANLQRETVFVDPLGIEGGMPNMLGGFIQRVTLHELVRREPTGPESPDFWTGVPYTKTLAMPAAQRSALARRLFTSQSDVSYAPPGDDPTGRPQSLGENAGLYSYAYMVRPNAAQMGAAVERADSFAVDTVVFHRRDYATAGEVALSVLTLTSSPVATVAGSLTILPGPVEISGTAVQLEEVKSKGWILIAATINTTDSSSVPFARWYRIRNRTELPSGDLLLSLDGPAVGPVAHQILTSPVAIYAAGVVGVYSRDVALSRD